jgi:tight adherence protein B
MSTMLSFLTGVSLFMLLYTTSKNPSLFTLFKKYLRFFALNPAYGSSLKTGFPILCSAASMLFLAISLISGYPEMVLLSGLLIMWPLPLKSYQKKQRLKKMNKQMDNMLANLANAVSVTGNLHAALQDVADGEPEPMRTALQNTLQEIRLGKTEEEALERFAAKSDIPLLKTAIGAVIVGKRSGGNMGSILSSTAAGIREIKRLEGVLKVKTAEGRNQAWVMGLMPIFLCGVLHLVNPEWLTPMWTTPMGWALLVSCILLEGIALFIIRKILEVTL